MRGWCIMARVTQPSVPLSLYLGPQLPRWQPRTTADVQAAIDNGTLTERHWLDVKLAIGAGSDSNNKEIARDLASFANDGGAVIYGVGEDNATSMLSLAPFDLVGQAERIDEIVRSRCEPPLYVACHPLPVNPDDRSHGLLLVEIRPSPDTPHMVDGRYHGRGDTTKRRLTDAEVARPRAVRTMRNLNAEQLIEQEIARDPGPREYRERTHVYVVARPLAAPPDLLTEAIERRKVSEIVRAATANVGSHASPNWHFLTEASFAILLTFVLPGMQAGQPPLLVAVTGAALIMFVVLYLTHGITAQTSVAVLGTLASLVLTGVLGTITTAATHLTGFGSEDATTLAMLQADVDLHGLLLAGIIIGSLGVLDDVTVTQAATVTELARANPDLTRLQLYRAAIRVGRAHIASTVNTIVLAYAGASLPLLLLLIASGRDTTELLTSEFMAQEIVRSAVATMGLIAAVPITTALAALVTTVGKTAPQTPSRTPSTIGTR
jgi:hypothetical protein